MRNCSRQSIQTRWRWHLGELYAELGSATAAAWEIAPVNERQHIAWARGREVVWLYQQVTVPRALSDYALTGLTFRLSLAWWAEDAQIFVDGQLVQSGDLFDYFTRICLAERVVPGAVYEVGIRLVSPGHDEGALVRSQLLYEVPNDADWPSPEPGFVADELAALQHYVQALAPARMGEIERAVEGIQWSVLSEDLGEAGRMAFHRSLAAVREQLAPLGSWLKQRRVSCLGHAHLDMVWLWPVTDTWQAAERTFESVLALQQDFPELTYTHSSPALFAWLEANRPELFARIQQAVEAGRWVIDAGLWIEPELNIISGESIARQILYGQRYCLEKFGTISTIAWLPDTFGFCHQLPQLLKQGGIEVFATQKLRWNDTTQFPHELFIWAAPDGSEVLGWTLPPIGTDFDPVQIAEYAAGWEAKTGLPQALWLPGVGDHGGGPTRDMLEKARRWAQSPLFPQVEFAHANDFIADVRSHLSQNSALQPLPRWNDELYLELHRGCYTTHADQKWQNRRCEDLLYEAELWSAIATLTVQYPYPQIEIEQAWKKVLFNQFHDILPGSAIPEVFEDANRDWAAAHQLAEQILEQALSAMQSEISLPAPPQSNALPVLVFNSLSWDRSETVEVALPEFALEKANRRWGLCDATGQTLSTWVQTVKNATGQSTERIIFCAKDVPAVGYRGYWLYPLSDNASADVAAAQSMASYPHATPNYCLENACIRATVEATTGNLVELFDHRNQIAILQGPANQLQTFKDDGQYWDAWNIAPAYEQHPLPPAQLLEIRWIEQGPVRQRLYVRRQVGQSVIEQIYCLETDSPLLKIETWIDWQETQVLLKVNFPTAFSADVATYETPFGAIARTTQARPPGSVDRANGSTHSQSNSDYAHQHAQTKWEVPALRWADISNDACGLSILTDGKHGFDAAPQQLRLTLLKSPLWPDPEADRGRHRFTYALYPHAGNWQQAGTVQWAHGLNSPLQIRQAEQAATGAMAGDARSFLRLNHAVLAAFKRAEAASDRFILRCYDADGAGLPPEPENSLGLSVETEVDLLENPLTEAAMPRPYQIRTYRLGI
ncbi:MAG: alpha-mannosidase [Cyanobacteria bacterium J06648_16]